ncbi:hypothetical protein [Sorangium sp. So ce381]|uniref:hypothetical protein n=1 Tax=Sorangium sp. So ce381 TaxID=3133307 RepID=UPI003F5B4748
MRVTIDPRGAVVKARDDAVHAVSVRTACTAGTHHAFGPVASSTHGHEISAPDTHAEGPREILQILKFQSPTELVKMH